jgi:oxygen-independent coproporphyrinogen-3 oxidase
MYELAGSMLDKAGFQSYEISNWASYDRSDNLLTCLHNLQYWRGKPYLGLGAGAHGYANHTRTANVLKPITYIERMRKDYKAEGWDFPVTPAAYEFTRLSLDEEMGEYMMMGLRLTRDGVVDKDFSQRFGYTLDQRYGSQIIRMINVGLLEWTAYPNRRLRLTKQGRLLGNQVFCEFI